MLFSTGDGESWIYVIVSSFCFLTFSSDSSNILAIKILKTYSSAIYSHSPYQFNNRCKLLSNVHPMHGTQYTEMNRIQIIFSESHSTRGRVQAIDLTKSYNA